MRTDAADGGSSAVSRVSSMLNLVSINILWNFKHVVMFPFVKRFWKINKLTIQLGYFIYNPFPFFCFNYLHHL